MKTAIIVTSINPPTKCMQLFAEGARSNSCDLIVVADKKSPVAYGLEGAIYLTVDEQNSAFPKFSKALPFNSYSRKNIGYLWAFRNGYERIIDTDDDNAPYEEFWLERDPNVAGALAKGQEWINAYSYFTDKKIWPRGFPLDLIHDGSPQLSIFNEALYCPIQQGLANENPDVDAVYRLTQSLPFNFDKCENDLILERWCWCPFNSQNTHWWSSAFPLTYLPSYCNFRMTDIWRSFVAQRILWENDWRLCFYNATVYQDRNEHNLIADFKDEIPGYLDNRKICSALTELDLKFGEKNIKDNMYDCYSHLVTLGFIGNAELPLVDAWLEATP